jgi:methionyl-tRNA synthetase
MGHGHTGTGSQLTLLLQGSDDEKRAAGEVLTAVLEAARIVAVLLAPVTPALSARIYSQLGLEGACAVLPQPTRLLGSRKGKRASRRCCLLSTASD